MRLRSLSVSLLSAMVLVPVCSAPALAADPSGSLRTAVIAKKVWKNSATKRGFIGPVAPTAPTAPAPTAPAPSVVDPVQAYQDTVLALTNRERTSRGLRALAPSACADGYAERWADSLLLAGALSHQPLSPILSACGARGVGENVAFGDVGPAELVAMWMNSAGHRANILNPAFTHLGVGTDTTSGGRVYAVQVFLTV